MKSSPDTTLRHYTAMIWATTPDSVGKRESIFAKSLDEARALLEKEYGKGTVFNLHNKEDANKPR